jgi:glycosyltransferase involved in cell wall biosynthesis
MVKVLWGSPLPPIRSGVSDYAVELLAEMHKLCQVRVLAPPDWDGDWNLPIPLVPADTQTVDREIALLHIGNNPFHEWLVKRALAESAVLVMHDLVLHHLLVESTVAKGRDEEFRKALTTEYGVRGDQIADGRAAGFTARRDPFLFPARSSVLASAQGAVVHSRWAAQQIRGERPDLPVGVVHLPARDPGSPNRKELRRAFGIEDETLLLMHLGFLTVDKGLESLLGAVAAAKRTGIRVKLVLVGQSAGASNFTDLVRSLDLEYEVLFTGWVSDEKMLNFPSAADLGIVLRDPSAGETSAAVLRFVACGTPVATVALHQYLEWPAEAVLRVTPGPSMTADLSRHIIAGGNDPDLLASRRTAIKSVFQKNHLPTAVARELVEYLESLG